MSISPARIAAFDILLRIQRERAFSSILLPLYEDALSPKDRALCHQLTLGVLRRQLYLDRAIDLFSDSKRLDDAVRISLRLGLFQLWFLDKIPAHPAVNESVELVRRAKKASARGFVNAILRRAGPVPISLTFADEIERLSVQTSHPRWLIERWIGQFGFEETSRLAEANNLEPEIAFRHTSRSESVTSFPLSRSSELVPGCFLADKVTPEMSAAASRGEIYFQDEGSQVVANSVRVHNNSRFLDVCAAPGSKFTQIAAHGNGSLFVAGDLYPHRARILSESIQRQGIANARVVVYNAEEAIPFPDETFDTILVDTPCSGTGTIRHNPELRYLLDPADLSELPAKQLSILRNASKLVREGGSLVYSTCSLEVDENEAVCEAFLASEPTFCKVRPAVPDRCLTSQGFARTMAHLDQMDGFFIAAFERSRPI